MDLFNYPKFKINKPIRLIELFGGIGSQAMALRNIGANFTHHRLVEFDKYAVKSYNAIHGTDFPTMDITKTKGEDLGITDTEKYCYVMTYSFPCQDLSLAGKQRGMKKDSGTRSGLLWEVERLLNEVEHLPQVLLMENVPQVIAEKNKPDFDKWVEFLRSKGYYNSYRVLNAKNYGVAQNRERCFMVSFLADEYMEYDFPETVKLNKTVKDYLEDVVDEKYYINNEKTRKLILNYTMRTNREIEEGVHFCCLDKPYSKENGFAAINDASISDIDAKEIRTITSRYYKGIAGNGDNMVLECNNNKKPVSIGSLNNFAMAENVYSVDGITPTLTAGMSHGKTIPRIMVENIKQTVRVRKYKVDVCGLQKLLKEHKTKSISEIAEALKVSKTKVEHWFRTDNSFSIPDENLWFDLKKLLKIQTNKYDNQIMEFEIKNNVYEKSNRCYSSEGISPTLTAMYGGGVPMVMVKQATKQGYITCKIGGVLDLSYPESETRRGRVQENGDICPTLTATQQDIVKIEDLYRIRKLTPRECWRLMGFSDVDFDKAASVNSDTRLYMQAGNSIVVNVLEALFRNMLN